MHILNQKLLEIRFKDENGQEVQELFTRHDHLVTGEICLHANGMRLEGLYRRQRQYH